MDLPLSSTTSSRPGMSAFTGLSVAMLAGLVLTAVFYHLLLPKMGHAAGLASDFFVLLLVGGLTGLYVLGNRLLAEDTTGKMTPQWVMGIGTILAAVSTWAIPPFNSRDVFGYINRGWQQVHYYANPYAVTIAELPGWQADPMLTDHWIHNPSPYGFLYMQLTQALCGLGMGKFLWTLFLFKTLNLLVVLGLGAMVYDLSKRFWPAHATRSFYLFLFSPLILLQTLAMGHNDILMAGCLALAAYLVLTRRWFWVLPALTAGCLMKYAAGVVLPLTVILVWRQAGWRVLLGSLVLSLGMVGLTGWPYLSSHQPIALSSIVENASVSTNSLHAMLEDTFQALARLNPAWETLRPGFGSGLKRLIWAAYLGVWLSALWSVWRHPRNAADGPFFVRVASILLALLVGVASSKFFGWYAVMVFPMAFCLPPGDWVRRILIVTSLSGLLGLTFAGDAHIINCPLMVGLPAMGAWWVSRPVRPRYTEQPAVN